MSSVKLYAAEKTFVQLYGMLKITWPKFSTKGLLGTTLGRIDFRNDDTAQRALVFTRQRVLKDSHILHQEKQNTRCERLSGSCNVSVNTNTSKKALEISNKSIKPVKLTTLRVISSCFAPRRSMISLSQSQLVHLIFLVDSIKPFKNEAIL